MAMETAEANAQELKQSLQPKMKLQSEVCWVEEPLKPSSRASGRRNKDGRLSSQGSRCFCCLSGRHTSRNCPMRNQICFECRKMVHKADSVFAVESEAASPVSQHASCEQVDDSDVYNSYYVDPNHRRGAQYDPPVLLEVQLNGRRAQMELDTGASASVMGEAMFWNVFGEAAPLRASECSFKTYTGEKIHVLGVADVDVAVEEVVTEKLPLVIVQGRGPGLIGRNWIRRIKFPWSKLLGEEQVRCLYADNLYNYIFKEEVCCYNDGKGNHFIDESAKPRFFKARPVPLSLQDKMDRKLDRLESQGVMKPVSYSD